MFWAIVGVVIGLVFLLAWRYDRTHRIRSGGIQQPEHGAATGDARMTLNLRNLGGIGPGRGP